MKKAITSGYGTNHYTIVIKRADWSISFYDAETGRHYTRRVWYPVHGSDIYVQHRGGFYSIMTEYKGQYDPQAISRYETVSADELKSMTAEIIAHRAGKQYADDLTWEETTRVYAYAVIFNNADTEATMTAIVNGILQNRDEQPEPATIEATEPEPEQTGEHMPIIYATDAPEATEATAQQVAELARDIRYDLQLTTFGPKDIEEARALTSRYADLTADVMEALGTSHVCDRTLVCIAHAMEAHGFTARDDTDQDADPAPLYQRAELDAYLGDYSDDYDVSAIEAEATEYDPKTGRRTWRPGVDLWEICERHEIAEYRPAIA